MCHRAVLPGERAGSCAMARKRELLTRPIVRLTSAPGTSRRDIPGITAEWSVSRSGIDVAKFHRRTGDANGHNENRGSGTTRTSSSVVRMARSQRSQGARPETGPRRAQAQPGEARRYPDSRQRRRHVPRGRNPRPRSQRAVQARSLAASSGSTGGPAATPPPHHGRVPVIPECRHRSGPPCFRHFSLPTPLRPIHTHAEQQGHS